MINNSTQKSGPYRSAIDAQYVKIGELEAEIRELKKPKTQIISPKEKLNSKLIKFAIGVSVIFITLGLSVIYFSALRLMNIFKFFMYAFAAVVGLLVLPIWVYAIRNLGRTQQ